MALGGTINHIITEEINGVILEKKNGKSSKRQKVSNILKDYKYNGKKRHHYNGNDDSDDDSHQFKKRKMAGGGFRYYDYDKYKRQNTKISKSDANSITNDIDVDAMNSAEIASYIYPDHTRTGAQSQLRKVLNHERPMTKPVAAKLSMLKSRGKIPVN